MMFWIPWGIDAAAALVFVYFFFVGIGDGSVGSDNILPWLLILIVCAVVVGGSLALRARGRTVPAMLLVFLTAIPCALIGLLMLVAGLFWPSH